MSSTTVDPSGNPIPTSSVLIAASKHIAFKCRAENMAFIKCKKKDPNPEKCLDKGREVTHCVLSLLKSLHQTCPKEMDAYAGCLYYHTNEFEFCRKEQEAFEMACPLSEFKSLHQTYPNEMDAYAGCLYYHTNKIKFCHKEQEAFEMACSLSELKSLHQTCPKEMAAYAGCLYYHTNEFEFFAKSMKLLRWPAHCLSKPISN